MVTKTTAAVVIPPLSDFYFTRHRFSSLGAHIVTDLLSGMGLQTTQLNLPLQDIKGTPLALPETLGHLKPFLLEGETGRLSFFTAYRRFGPSPEKSARLIEAIRPDVCFFSLFAFCYTDDAIELGRAVKARMPRIPLVIGGAGASVYPEYLLGKRAFDFVLTGEAEARLPHFIAEIRHPAPDFCSVPGLVAQATQVVETHGHASLSGNYPAAGEMRIPLFTSARSSRTVTWSASLARGCPKRCDFCSSSLLFGPKLRTASLDELDRLLRKRSGELTAAGKRVVINLEDDNLLCDEAYLKAAIGLFRKHLPTVELVAENGLDYSLLTPGLCAWLVENGIRKFNLSLASTSPQLLRNKGRLLDLDRYEMIIAFLAEKQIPVVTYFICGFQEDTVETIAATLSYLDRRPTLIGISPFYPVPGLPGFENRSRFDLHPSCLCCGSSMFPWNGSLSTATMVTAFRLSRWSNLRKIPKKKRTAAENEALERIERERKIYTVVRRRTGDESVVGVPEMDEELVKLVIT